MKWTFLGAVLAGVGAGVVSSAGLPFMVRHVFPIIFADAGSGEARPIPESVQRLATWLTNQPLDESSVLVLACAMLPLVFLLRGVLLFINGYFLAAVGLRVVESIRLQAFSRLQCLSLSFHQSHREGDLISRIIADTAMLQKALVRVAADLVIQPATLLGAGGILLYLAISSQGALFMLLALVSLPVLVLPLRAYGGAIVSRARKSQGKAGDLTAHLSENLASQPDIRAYNLQEKQTRLFANLADQFVRLQLKTIKYNRLIGPTVEMVSALAIGFAVYLGARQGMSMDVFLPMVMALYFAYDPIKKLGVVMGQLKQAEASLERISLIVDSQDMLPEPTQPMPLSEADGSIRFDRVTFQYEQEPILSEIELEIKAGETVAIVGPSGVGKSTLVSLVCRFYDPEQGSVSIGGINLKHVVAGELRSQIALVSQHPLLFSGSIMDNIRVGNPDASDDKVKDAAKLARIHEDIHALEAGYQTLLGQRGEGLSGGQRQRMAIARAFLKDAPILILDEATSALDSESEAGIQEALAELCKGRTTILIAHRFSSIKHASRILVMDKTLAGGAIVADGTHDEVYATSALYRQLYDQQKLSSS